MCDGEGVCLWEGGERRGALPPVCWSPGCRHHCIAHRVQSESLNTSTLRETDDKYNTSTEIVGKITSH